MWRDGRNGRYGRYGRYGPQQQSTTRHKKLLAFPQSFCFSLRSFAPLRLCVKVLAFVFCCADGLLVKRNLTRYFPLLLLAAVLIVPLLELWHSGAYGTPGIARSDYEYYFSPQRVFLARWLHRGVFPFWNPHLFCGYPVVESLQTALFYPLNTLFLMTLPPAPGLLVFLSLHIVGAAAATYFALHRALRLSATAAAAGALVHVMGAVFASRFLAGHLISTCAITWMPLAVAALMRHLEDRRRDAVDENGAAPPNRNYLFLSVVATALIFLSGGPQYALYTVWMQATVAVFALGTPRLTRLASCLIIWVWAALIAAPQLAPVILYTPYAARGAGSYSANTSLFSLISAAFEFFFRYPAGDGITRVHLNRRGVWDHAGYCGTAALLLAAAGAAAALAHLRQRRGVQALQACAILALGVIHITFGWLPGFEFFREPMRALGFMIVAVAILSAIALTLLAEGGAPARRLRRALVVLSSLFAVGTTAAALWAVLAPSAVANMLLNLGEVSATLHPSVTALIESIGRDPRLASGPFATAMMQGAALASATALLALLARRRPRAAVVAFALLMAADVTTANHLFFRSWLQGDQTGWSVEARAGAEAMVAPSLAGEAMPARTSLPGEMSNASQLIEGMAEPFGYDPLQPFLSGSRGPTWTAHNPPPDVTLGPRLRRQSLATRYDITALPGTENLPEETLQTDRRYQITDTDPSAGVATLAAAAAERSVGEPTFGPLNGALDFVAPGTLPADLVTTAPPGGAPGGDVGHVRHVPQDTPNALRFDAITTGPALLMVRVTWLPGWSLTLNDQPAPPPIRANGWMMAIPLPPGLTKVHLTYRPPCFPLWLTLSLTAALLLVAEIVIPKKNLDAKTQKRKGDAKKNRI